MTRQYLCEIVFALLVLGLFPGQAGAQGYPGYPNTIMAPEPTGHHRAGRNVRMWHGRPFSRVAHAGQRVAVAHGSPGIVLPTPLPRTPFIPPEGGSMPTVHATPPQPGPTFVPGLANPVPNLPHGAETFQDRASRCAFQQGLYNVPGNMSTQYMAACLQ